MNRHIEYTVQPAVLKWGINPKFCIEIQPGSLLKSDVHFNLVSLDQFIGEDLGREAGGEEDPGGERDDTEHWRVETFPGEVETL